MFKKYLITGLLLWVPLAITIWVILFIINLTDGVLFLIPDAWLPKRLIGFDIPGLGLVIDFLVLLITGVLARNLIGQRVVDLWEKLLTRIPVVKSIYSSVKQVSDTLLSDSGNSFRKALLIEYPRQGSWTVAFLTGTPSGEIAKHFTEPHVSVYVPTTPNPTSGFFLMVPKSTTHELDMSVDAALKYIISMGVVSPSAKRQNLKKSEIAIPASQL